MHAGRAGNSGPGVLLMAPAPSGPGIVSALHRGSLNLHSTLQSRAYYHPHFTDEKTDDLKGEMTHTQAHTRASQASGSCLPEQSPCPLTASAPQHLVSPNSHKVLGCQVAMRS